VSQRLLARLSSRAGRTRRPCEAHNAAFFDLEDFAAHTEDRKNLPETLPFRKETRRIENATLLKQQMR
jgi:hypothetical protein